MSRHLKPECASDTFFGANAEFVVVTLKYLLYYGKSKSRADDLTLALFRAVVAVEDERYQLGIDVCARVGYFDPDKLFLLDYLRDINGFIFTRVVDGVVDKVVNYLLYLYRICFDDEILLGGNDKVIAFLLGKQSVAFHYASDRVGDAEFRFGYLKVAAFKFGKVEDIIDKRCKPVALLDDNVEMLGALLRIIARNIAYHLGVGFYHCQRCSQVVRNVRYKVTAESIDL